MRTTLLAFLPLLTLALAALPERPINALDVPLPAPPVATPAVTCTGTVCLPPAKGALKVSSTTAPVPAPVDPLAAAMAKVAAAAADVAVKAKRVADLAAAQTDLAAAKQALADARAEEAAILDPLGPTPAPGPGPGPSPAPGHVVTLLAVTSPATCPPCKAYQPTLDALKAQGIPITFVDGSSAAVCDQWKVTAIPTLIVLDNGKEIVTDNPNASRATGPRQQASLVDWYKGWQDFVKAAFPTPTP